MSTGVGYGDSAGNAEVVRDAAWLSLAARGVRVYRARVREAGGGWTEPWSWEIGVADPAARSIRVMHSYSEDSPVVKLAEASARRWPWVGGEGTGENAERVEAETIEIERQTYYGGPNRWTDWSDLPFYGPARGLWPLEAILASGAAARAGSIDVRGDPCTRYVTEVVPGDVAGQTGVKLVDPPDPDDDWRALSADVSIDGSGLVRRIAWSPATGTRFKPGLLPRLAMALDRRPTPDASAIGEGRLWNIVEFWDYGCEVEIVAPTDLVTRGDAPPMHKIVRDLWQMRRQYKRRGTGSG